MLGGNLEEPKKRKLAVNWRQAAGEAFLICLGVGVALLGQAWWEARTERVVVQQHFDGLLDELRRNQEGLREFEDVQNASVRRAATVLRLMGEPPSSERDDSLVAFSWTMVSHNYFVPATAAMSNLVSAGGLGLIQDPALRLKVTEYAQSVESFNSFTADLRDCQLRDMRPADPSSGESAMGGGSGETRDHDSGVVVSRGPVLAQDPAIREPRPPQGGLRGRRGGVGCQSAP